MALEEHVERLKAGVSTWNAWREHACGKSRLRGEEADVFGHPEIDLSGANLEGLDLAGADLSFCNLANTKLAGSDLARAELHEASLAGADMYGVNFTDAQVVCADLSGAELSHTDLSHSMFNKTSMDGVRLLDADLSDTVFRLVTFEGTVFCDAYLSGTIFSSVDLSKAIDLEDCNHGGSSSIDSESLYRSGKLPLSFLRGIGLSDEFIDYIPSLFGDGIKFYSAFLSHNSGDKAFVRHLDATLQARGVRCWLDEKEIRPGDDLYDEIDRGIQLWDKLILVCSEQSLNSWWVEHEWSKAMSKERRLREKRGKKVLAIIPVDIDGYIFRDECTLSVKDEILKRGVADFRCWKDHDAFMTALDRLLLSLRADEDRRAPAPAPRL